MASRGGPNPNGGWDFRSGGVISPDGNWNYNWGTDSGSGGTTFGFGSSASSSPNGGGFGFGWGSSTSIGASRFGFGAGSGGVNGAASANFNSGFRFGFGFGGSIRYPTDQVRSNGEYQDEGFALDPLRPNSNMQVILLLIKSFMVYICNALISEEEGERFQTTSV